MSPDEFVRKYRPFRFYHFTDTRNLQSIRAHGGLHSLATCREREISIAAPGGNAWSHEADENAGLDTYVHLCLRDQHPMEYRARQDGRILEPIYLQIHPGVVRCDGIRFSPDVSNKAGVPLLTLDEAAEQLDFEVIYRWTDWRDREIQKRLRRAAKYELLVPRNVPLEMILNI